MEQVLTVSRVHKEFSTGDGQRIVALEDVSMGVEENEFVCIVGPSGCGKSTLLRMAAGLEPLEQGTLQYRTDPIARPRREIGMVFQEYSLLPWRSVRENVALGLEFAGMGKQKRDAEALRYLELVNLRAFANAMPYELSGGMRQRVAIARALANRPDLLLMDEPFGALDAHTRILLQKELLRIRERHRTTIVFVTHSVDEAVYLADTIVVMTARPGTIATTLKVGLPHPRDRADPRFARLTADILAMLDSAGT